MTLDASGFSGPKPNLNANINTNPTGGSMPIDPITAISVGTSAVSAIGSLFGGGSSQESGLKLPDSIFEYDLIENFDARMEAMQADIAKLDTMEKYFTDKMSVYQSAIEGQILDSDVTKGLQDMNVSLAQQLGVSAEELAANGFLSDADVQDMNSLKELESADFEDPTQVRQLEEQKAQMMAEMRRAGSSPQEITQALNQFETQAREAKFSRSQELKQSQAGLISNRMGLRQGTIGQNVGLTNNAIAQGRGILDSNLSTIGMGANLTSSTISGQSSLIQSRQALRGEQQGTLSNLGEFKLSSQGKDFANARLEGVSAVDHREDYATKEKAAAKARTAAFHKTAQAGFNGGF